MNEEEIFYEPQWDEYAEISDMFCEVLFLNISTEGLLDPELLWSDRETVWVYDLA